MRDKISIERVGKLHPKIILEVVNLIEQAESKLPNTAIRIVQGLRTFEEQNHLYAQGRTIPGNRVTNSKGGQSYHCYGLAIDFALLYDKDSNGSYESLSWDILKDFDKDGQRDWLEVVDIFEDAGYYWGGHFSKSADNPHLEKNFGHHWKELLKMYEAGNFIPGTNYVNI